ncbi:Retinal dehydrogenase 1 [Balamuthia mandrillaris]
MEGSGAPKIVSEKLSGLLDDAAQLQLFINNEHVPSLSGKTLEVIAPATEEVLATVALGEKDDIDRAVEAAEQALEGEWKTMSGSKRRDLLLKLATLWEREAPALGKLEALNNGTLPAFQGAVIGALANDWRFNAGWADKIDGRVVEASPGTHTYVRREPIGVCGLILPWNVPLWTLVVKLAPCLAMGNTVVIKPAEQTPLTALRIASLFKEAGFPPGVVNVVPGFGGGPSGAGAALASHMKVRKLAFTGSTEVGRLILKAAADSNLKRVQLELGGKSPMVIFEDADLDKAVQLAQRAIFWLVVSCFLNFFRVRLLFFLYLQNLLIVFSSHIYFSFYNNRNNGQLCTAGSRTFVHESIYDQFVEKATAAAQSIRVGDPSAEAVEVGPVVDKPQFEKVLHYLESGKKEGAVLKTGGGKAFPDKKGYFIQPTVFADVTDDMEIARDEIFGPVQSIIKFSEMKDLVKRCNATEYGLAAGVVTNDISKVFELANHLAAGTVWVNTYHEIATAAEFGGYKQSGFGREGGCPFDEWTISKTVVVRYKSAF